jgi:hypothetical protein
VVDITVAFTANVDINLKAGPTSPSALRATFSPASSAGLGGATSGFEIPLHDSLLSTASLVIACWFCSQQSNCF